jgi:hypothetical protein
MTGADGAIFVGLQDVFYSSVCNLQIGGKGVFECAGV